MPRSEALRFFLKFATKRNTYIAIYIYIYILLNKSLEFIFKK